MKRFAIIAAATLAAGGIGYVGCDNDDTASNTGQTAGDKVDRAVDRAGDVMGNATDKTVEAGREAGDAVSGATQRASDRIAAGDRGTPAAPDAEGIRDVLASVAEAALTKGGLNDVTERLVDADRNRIGEAVDAEFAEHDALVTQFRADWKAKYGEEFDITDEEAALPNTLFTIRQGEVPQGAAGTDVDVDRDVDGSTEVDVDRKSGVDAPDNDAADTNRNDPGRNTATVEVKESHGSPALTVPLIHEAPDNWRIDIPDSVDANKLRQNVLDHLKAAHDMRAQWPPNVQNAYAAVTHHVLMALLDQPAK